MIYKVIIFSEHQLHKKESIQYWIPQIDLLWRIGRLSGNSLFYNKSFYKASTFSRGASDNKSIRVSSNLIKLKKFLKPIVVGITIGFIL